VLLPSAGQALIAPVRARGGWAQEFSDPGKAYPP
jgi:hypothetical protein